MRAFYLALTLLALPLMARAQPVSTGVVADPRDADFTGRFRRGVALRREAAVARAGAALLTPERRDAQRTYAARRDAEADAAFAEAADRIHRPLVGDAATTRAGREQRASALFSGRRYEDAAREYAALGNEEADTPRSDLYAGMTVRALEAQILAEATSGVLDPCIAVRAGANPGPEFDPWGVARCRLPAGDEIPLPPLVARLLQALREYPGRHLRVPSASLWPRSEVTDARGERVEAPTATGCMLESARLLYRFGHLRVAEWILREIVFRCEEPSTTQRARETLVELLESQRRLEDVERVRREMRDDRCPRNSMPAIFRPPAPSDPFRGPIEHLQSLGPPVVLTGTPIRYERAVSDLTRVIRENRLHPLVVLACTVGAQIVEATEHYADAVVLLQLALAAPTSTSLEEGGIESTWRPRIRLHLGQILEAQGARDEALEQMRQAFTEARGAAPFERRDLQRSALDAVVRLVDPQRSWREAVDALDTVVAEADASQRVEASFERARLPFRAERWRESLRAMNAWLGATPSGDGGVRRVQAWWELAQAHRRLGEGALVRIALEQVAHEFWAQHIEHDSPAAEFAADALAASIEARVTALLQQPGTSPALWRTALQEIDRDAWIADRLRGAGVLVARYHVGRAFELGADRLGDASLRRRAIERYLAVWEAAVDAGTVPPSATAAHDRLREGFTFAEVDAALRERGASMDVRRHVFHGAPAETLLEYGRVACELAR